jgi:hypothetical protein
LHSLVVDLQANIDFANCSLYNTSIAMVPSPRSTGPVPQVTSTNLTYSEAVQTQSEFHGKPHWTNATGLLGLAYKEMSKDGPEISEGSKRSTFTSLLDSVHSGNMFGLDFNPPGEESFVHLGGLDRGVHWGESPPDEAHRDEYTSSRRTTSDGYHTFSMFHLSVCGVSLFGNMSGYWTAIVDTGTAGLVLPAAMFDTLMKWVPNTEGEPEPWEPKSLKQGGCNKRRVFYIDENVVNRTELPWLNFQMSEGSPLLYIPLADLLYKRPSDAKTHPTRSYYAIQSFESTIGDDQSCVQRIQADHPHTPFDSPRVSLYNQRISIGSMVLRSLYAGFDYDTRRVGFANKPRVLAIVNDRSAGVHERCAAPSSCVGEQVLQLSTNSCPEPNCAKFFFQEVDPATSTCQLNRGIQYLMYSLFGICALAEVIMHVIYEHAILAVRNMAAGAMGPPRTRYCWERARAAISGWLDSPPATW